MALNIAPVYEGSFINYEGDCQTVHEWPGLSHHSGLSDCSCESYSLTMEQWLANGISLNFHIFGHVDHVTRSSLDMGYGQLHF